MNTKHINTSQESIENTILLSLRKSISLHVGKSTLYIVGIHSMYLNYTIIDEIFQFDYLFCKLFFILSIFYGFFFCKILLYLVNEINNIAMTEIFLNTVKTIHYFNKYKSHAFFLI